MATTTIQPVVAPAARHATSPRRSTDIEELFAALDTAVVAFALDLRHGEPPALGPTERSAVASATASRRREFAGGRACARAALAEVGFASATVGRGEDRAPIWPSGAVGSITHTGELWLAVIAEHRTYPGGRDVPAGVGIGVDAECVGSVTPDIEHLLFHDDEQARLRDSPDPDRSVTAAFSAKEALYKAQYALDPRWVDFTDVEAIPGRPGAFDLRRRQGTQISTWIGTPVEARWISWHGDGIPAPDEAIVVTAVVVNRPAERNGRRAADRRRGPSTTPRRSPADR